MTKKKLNLNNCGYCGKSLAGMNFSAAFCSHICRWRGRNERLGRTGHSSIYEREMKDDRQQRLRARQEMISATPLYLELLRKEVGR